VAWLPDDFEHPTRVDLPTGQHLRPMGAADTEIDHPAVMGSRERLWTIYGDAWGWPPAHMTPEQDREDLAHHEAEAEQHLSFNYALFDEGETELIGCVYIDPATRPGGDAEVSWWVRDEYVGGALETALDEFVPGWLAEAWPFESPAYLGREISWKDWLARPVG